MHTNSEQIKLTTIERVYERSFTRYEELRAECEEKGWWCEVIALEVGCRGFANRPTTKLSSKEIYLDLGWGLYKKTTEELSRHVGEFPYDMCELQKAKANKVANVGCVFRVGDNKQHRYLAGTTGCKLRLRVTFGWLRLLMELYWNRPEAALDPQFPAEDLCNEQ